MKRSVTACIIVVTVVVVWAATHAIGTAHNWRFDALNIYGWLPIASIIGLGYLALYIYRIDYRPLISKILQLLLYIHIYVFIYELWQNSASFPPISTRQYIVEICKLCLVYMSLGAVAHWLKNYIKNALSR